VGLATGTKRTSEIPARVPMGLNLPVATVIPLNVTSTLTVMVVTNTGITSVTQAVALG